jgi:hypothetical protein
LSNSTALVATTAPTVAATGTERAVRGLRSHTTIVVVLDQIVATGFAVLPELTGPRTGVVIVVAVRVVIAIVSAGGWIDDGGNVVVPATGISNGDAVVSAGRVDPEAAQRSREYRAQQAPPRAARRHGPR